MKKNSKLILKFLVGIMLLGSLISPMSNLSKALAAGTTLSSDSNIELTFDESYDNDVKYQKIASVKKNQGISNWHYSGGFWGVSTDKERRNIPDYLIPGGDISKLDEIVQNVFGGIRFDIDYPEEVKKALRENQKVIIKLSSASPEIKISDYIYDTDDIKKHKIANNGSSMTLTVPFKYNYEKVGNDLLTYRDYGLNLGFKLPVVKRDFGSNGYAIFERGGSPVKDWASYWTYGQKAEDGFIDPIIIDGKGTLKPGYNINTSLGNFDSSTIQVGHGTFNNGGAVGLNFGYNFQFDFYIENDNPSNLVMKELVLMDAKGEKELDSFRREVDPLDPLNVDKQKLIRTSTGKEAAPMLKGGEKYVIKAKYQFISFEKGKFDISKESNMNKEQKLPYEATYKYNYLI